MSTDNGDLMEATQNTVAIKLLSLLYISYSMFQAPPSLEYSGNCIDNNVCHLVSSSGLSQAGSLEIGLMQVGVPCEKTQDLFPDGIQRGYQSGEAIYSPLAKSTSNAHLFSRNKLGRHPNLSQYKQFS